MQNRRRQCLKPHLYKNDKTSDEAKFLCQNQKNYSYIRGTRKLFEFSFMNAECFEMKQKLYDKIILPSQSNPFHHAKAIPRCLVLDSLYKEKGK